MKKIQPDIIHAHYATSAGLTALVSGFHPSVVTVHGSDLTIGIKSRIWRPILKKIFNYADCINVVSDDLSEMVLSLGIDKRKIKTFTLGIDTERYSFTQKSEIEKSRPLKLVCTRRLEPVFDHFTIINALGLLKEKRINFQMTFVGDGTLLNEMQQRVDALGLAESVNFTGRIPNDDLPEILKQQDIYLSASLWDGASLSLLEAMATGLFPIVSDIKANSAWIENGVDGFLHKVGDSKDLAECIIRLSNNPEIVNKASLNNRKKVVEKADRNTNMKFLESVYKDLIKK
jgi:glycosyltransferase involved in cell wall biosynthesis